jgi:hypothetical protein
MIATSTAGYALVAPVLVSLCKALILQFWLRLCSSRSIKSTPLPTSHHQLSFIITNMSNLPDVEKDHAGHDSVNGNGMKYDLHHDHHDEDTALRRLRTAGSLTISPELFEKIYLSPKNQVSNNIRSTFGNPTPLYV